MFTRIFLSAFKITSPALHTWLQIAQLTSILACDSSKFLTSPVSICKGRVQSSITVVLLHPFFLLEEIIGLGARQLHS